MFLVPSDDAVQISRAIHTEYFGICSSSCVAPHGGVRLFDRYAVPTGKYVNMSAEDIADEYDIAIRYLSLCARWTHSIADPVSSTYN